ncbi:serine protease [soil metagenome]
MDISVELIRATVQLEQPTADGKRTVGTGFLISAPTPDGKPRTVLVTANHVFAAMPGTDVKIGYRIEGVDGSWTFKPRAVPIRRDGAELWTRNPDRDVAAIVVEAPPEFAKAAIPLAWLADGDAFARYNIGPGDEMMALGFPWGMSANGAGFPILRSGKVASYPVAPSKQFPTFMLDFTVFPGNSGGPVFLQETVQEPGDAAPHKVQLIAGLLTQELYGQNNERIGLGVVTQASFVRETVALLDRPGKASAPALPIAAAPEPSSADVSTVVAPTFQ